MDTFFRPSSTFSPWILSLNGSAPVADTRAFTANRSTYPAQVRSTFICGKLVEWAYEAMQQEQTSD